MRKILSFLLSMILIMSCTTTLFAKTNDNNTNEDQVVSGDSMGDYNVEIKSVEEQVNDILSTKKLSKKQKEDLKIKLSALDSTVQTSAIAAKTLNVTYYKQAYDYYCGPATTKQTMQFLKGSSDTQSNIANALGTTTNGTDGTKIVQYLNNNSSYYYVIKTSPTEAELKSITSVMAIPQIARVKFAKAGSWTYSTPGHFFNVSGYNAGQTLVRITDPYIGWVTSGHSGSYFVSYTELYKAINDHFAKHLYY